MSYIVRNCPCIKHYDDIELDNRCMGNEHIPYFCENNPDCVIKQVIEKCKDAKLECSCKNPDPDIDCFECTSGGRAELGQEILNMFDIEEIGE